jgi:hypothetical protein
MRNSKKVEDRVIRGWGNAARSCNSPIPLSPYPPIAYEFSGVIRFILGIFLFFGITSCYEDRNGCLDLRATNFDIDADRECDNCCVYPQLKLAFEHKLSEDSAGINLTYNTSVYWDGAGNEFRVKDIQFYVSNAYLVREDGTEVYPSDSLNVRIQPPGGDARAQKIADNVALINRNNFTPAEMGRLVSSGNFTKIRFTIGLPDVLNQVIPNSLPDSLVNHPLENTTMYVNADTGFIFNRLQLFTSATLTDTLFTTYKIVQPDSVEVELPINLNIVEGFNPKVTVRINYLTWFQNVDLKNDTPASVATKLVQNLQNALTITGVEMEGL